MSTAGSHCLGCVLHHHIGCPGLRGSVLLILRHCQLLTFSLMESPALSTSKYNFRAEVKESRNINSPWCDFLHFLSLKFHGGARAISTEWRLFIPSQKIVSHCIFLDLSFPATRHSSRVHYLSSPGLLFPHWQSLQRLAWCFWGRTEKNERRWPACYHLIPGGCNSSRAQRCRGIHCCAFSWPRKRELPSAWNDDGRISGLQPLPVMTDWNIGLWVMN